MRLSASSVMLGTAILFASASAFTIARRPRSHVGRSARDIPREITIPAARKSTTSLHMSAEAFAKSEIAENEVVVFSKTYCGFCGSTKALFKQLGVDAKYIELDVMGSEGAAIQDALVGLTGQRSVPNVFIKGQHIGGNDDTQAAARSGTLQELLGISKD